MLKENYQKDIVHSLMSEFGYVSIMQVPKIVKISLNMGLGGMDTKRMERASNDLTLVAGQKAVITKARKSVAGFKIRSGHSIGSRVTLRSSKMFEFLERLLYLALPRARDFRGFDKSSFDGCGNYSFGIKEISIFPEAISDDFASGPVGMDVSITTTARNDDEAMKLLEMLGFPFKSR